MITKNIDKAITLLNQENIIAIPTETVYGLAGNIFSEIALKKIFELKNRPFNNPLIVHVKSIDQIQKIASEIPEIAFKLAEKFWPGPLTLVLKKQPHISDLVTANKDTVAIRMPNHKRTLELLQKLDFPLAAPSANPFGSISPTSSKHVLDYFNDKLELILEGGNCEEGIESTIIGFEDNQVVLYRHGSITIDEIEKVVGKITDNSKNDIDPKAPGMFSRHYAPKTDTFLTNNVVELIKSFPNQKIGLLLFQNDIKNPSIKYQEILSKSGDLSEAARNLYAAMHRLDEKNIDIIIAEIMPDSGLGRTMNDRLQRAIKKS
jgi:L-threonylcarbamoyladenylate synthase